jgi:hypothetical protein
MDTLAPVVERVADWLDRRSGVASTDPVLRSPPVAGWVRLRPVARKLLSYDYEMESSASLGGALLYMLGFFTVVTLATSFVRHDPRVLVATVVLMLLMFACAVSIVLAMAKRLCHLRRHIARCEVVQGRVIAAPVERAVNSKTGAVSFSCKLTIEYLYAGKVWRGQSTIDAPMGALIGWAPELLVDTQDPTSFLFRVFYN